MPSNEIQITEPEKQENMNDAINILDSKEFYIDNEVSTKPIGFDILTNELIQWNNKMGKGAQVICTDWELCIPFFEGNSEQSNDNMEFERMDQGKNQSKDDKEEGNKETKGENEKGNTIVLPEGLFHQAERKEDFNNDSIEMNFNDNNIYNKHFENKSKFNRDRTGIISETSMVSKIENILQENTFKQCWQHTNNYICSDSNIINPLTSNNWISRSLNSKPQEKKKFEPLQIKNWNSNHIVSTVKNSPFCNHEIYDSENCDYLLNKDSSEELNNNMHLNSNKNWEVSTPLQSRHINNPINFEGKNAGFKLRTQRTPIKWGNKVLENIDDKNLIESEQQEIIENEKQLQQKLRFEQIQRELLEGFGFGSRNEERNEGEKILEDKQKDKELQRRKIERNKINIGKDFNEKEEKWNLKSERNDNERREGKDRKKENKNEIRENDRKENNKREIERLENEKWENEWLENERRENERLEIQRREKERLEIDRREKESQERVNREKEELEYENRENKTKENERLENEKLNLISENEFQLKNPNECKSKNWILKKSESEEIEEIRSEQEPINPDKENENENKTKLFHKFNTSEAENNAIKKNDNLSSPKNKSIMESTNIPDSIGPDLLKAFNAVKPEENKKIIISILKKINTFETKSPNISEITNYPNISVYKASERSIFETISNYESIFLKEDNKPNFEKRKTNFLSLRSFSGRIEQNQTLISLLSSFKRPHPLIMSENYKNNKENLLKDILQLTEEEIFNDQNLNSSYNQLPLIGEIESISTFFYKYSTQESIKIMNTGLNNFKHWRNSYCDGNSFYRVIMFQWLEHYITNNSVEDLKALILDITNDTFSNYYNTKSFDICTVYSIFKIIVDYLDKKQTDKAYNILIKSYQLQSMCFDELWIAYLRKLVFNYISELRLLYISQDNKVEDESGKDQQGKFNFINHNAIEFNHIEPEFIIWILLPYWFTINLTVFWVDGKFLKSKHSVINFTDEENKDIPLITIGCFYNGFYPWYRKELPTSIKDFQKWTYLIPQTQICTVCKKTSNIVVFLLKKFKTCLSCLQSHIMNVIKQRAKLLSSCRFIGQEYYCRDIHWKDNYYISDHEIIEIYQTENIYSWLNTYSRTICLVCNKVVNPKELKELPSCHCKYCENCLLILIDKATNGLKVINNYEALNTPVVKCLCGKNWNIFEAGKICSSVNDSDWDSAIKRMKEYIRTMCMKCLKVLFDNVKEESVDSKKVKKTKQKAIAKYLEIFIQNDESEGKGLLYSDLPHWYCYDCFLKDTKKVQVPKDEDIDQNEKKIGCKICRREHVIDKMNKNWNDKVDTCCGGGCMLY